MAVLLKSNTFQGNRSDRVKPLALILACELSWSKRSPESNCKQTTVGNGSQVRMRQGKQGTECVIMKANKWMGCAVGRVQLLLCCNQKLLRLQKEKL